MDGLIIAAGSGSRLRTLSPCKPLASVGGKALIEHAATSLAAAGVRRIVVVTGYMAEEVEAVLPGIASRLGVECVPVRVADWTLPNGHSVMAGATLIDGEYLLVMADHIFSPTILPALLKTQHNDAEVVLAVDSRLDNVCIDPDDATFVRLDGDGRITTIGKGLDKPDAVDCGAFRASKSLARAIAQAIAEGRPGSLSDGVQYLARQGLVDTQNIGDAWWIDVDEPASYAIAQAALSEASPIPARGAEPCPIRERLD